MSRVDFYILPDGNGVDRFACNITAKAWSKGNSVYIHTRSDDKANMMDKLLWTYQDISFIPHKIYGQENDEFTPVTIGSGNGYSKDAQVLVNLDTDIPVFVNHFDRIVEIVGGNETEKQFARKRYKKYMSGDYEIHDHKLKSV